MRNRLTAGLIATAAAALILVPAASQAAAHKHAAKAATRVASGTVESYDSSAKTLTVKGARDTWTFSVGDAKVWMGSKSMDAGDLSSHSGARVTVRYTEKDGQKTASSVRVAAAHAKASKAKSKS
jgi:phage baseplate assembly protein gpV